MSTLFQFQCPQGCLVQAEVAHAGMETACPSCGAAMIIPAPPSASGPGSPPAKTAKGPGVLASGRASETKRPLGPKFSLGPTGPSSSPTNLGNQATPTVDRSATLLHIPCPNGHLLETPREMLRQQVMCPHCSATFTLREKDSEEHRIRRQIEIQGAQRKLSRAWLNFAIILAVVCGVAMALMVWLSN